MYVRLFQHENEVIEFSYIPAFEVTGQGMSLRIPFECNSKVVENVPLLLSTTDYAVIYQEGGSKQDNVYFFSV
jgi:hypothetical protein